MSLHDFAGKVALVTGGGSGIGRATCVQLASEGARVVVTDVSLAAAQQTLSMMPGSGQHLVLQMDVTQRTAVEEVITAAREQLGEPPSLLVNSAGIVRGAPCHLMDEEAFDSVINVNLKGTFLVCQAFTRALLKEAIIGEHRGAIVNVSSIDGKAGQAGHCQYCASKSGVMTLTKSCAAELAKEGVRVNAVLPGAVDTAWNASLNQKLRQDLCTMIPLGRLGRPEGTLIQQVVDHTCRRELHFTAAEKIAEVIVFLLPRRSSYITGTCVEVTGGLHM